MKKIKFVLLLAASLLIFGACATTAKTKQMPPGQAKKITGSQSAKPYAPGQQKK